MWMLVVVGGLELQNKKAFSILQYPGCQKVIINGQDV
jgi:hypothetical protein